MLKKLPKIFSAVRHKLPRDLTPPLVLDYSNARLQELFDALDVLRDSSKPQDDVKVTLYHLFFMEAPGVGLLFKCWPEEDERPVRGVDVWVMDKGGLILTDKPVRIDMADIKGAAKEQPEIVRMFMAVSHDLWRMSNRPAPLSVDTKTRNTPRLFARQGDTVRYARIADLQSASGQHRDYQPPEEPSGIRKAEHQVRGHWRQYRSGARVWVKSHKRGDPELGTVTRVLKG